MFWNKADSQWVKDTRLLSLVPPEGKKKLCHPTAILESCPLDRELTLPVFPCCLHYQSKTLGDSLRPAQREPWMISPTMNSWHLAGWFPWRGTAAVPRHRSHRKVLMGGSSLVNPQREKGMERRMGIPACSQSSPLLAGFHASFKCSRKSCSA